MKVTVKERDVVERKYPYLGQYKINGYIALFISKDCGIVLYQSDSQDPAIQRGLDESFFDYYTGEVVLSNE